MSQALTGHSVSEKTKALISQRLKDGFTDERRQQISERNTKTTDQQRVEIIERYQTGNISASDLAKEYDLSITTITNIIKDTGVPFVHGQGGHYATGEKHPQAKLTAETVISIYKMKGNKTGREAARDIGISPQCVSKIWKKQQWKSVTDAIDATTPNL
jgi:DNA invertase Pin-like site-specific DNA recombinase